MDDKPTISELFENCVPSRTPPFVCKFEREGCAVFVFLRKICTPGKHFVYFPNEKLYYFFR